MSTATKQDHSCAPLFCTVLGLCRVPDEAGLFSAYVGTSEVADDTQGYSVACHALPLRKQRIIAGIIADFSLKPRLNDDRGTAILVAANERCDLRRLKS